MEHPKWWYALPAIKLVGMVGIPLAILGGASCIKGCEDKKAQKTTLEEKVGFRTLYKKKSMLPYSPDWQIEPHGRIITTEAELQELYSKTSFDLREIDGKFFPILPDYKPDFSKEMVIAVFQGQRPTTGYGIELTSIIETEDSLVISSNLLEPSSGMAGAAITHPGHYVVCRKIENKPAIHFDYKIIDPFEKVYAIFPADNKKFYELPKDLSSDEKFDFIKSKAKEWHFQLKRDCDNLGIVLPKHLSDVHYQEFAIAEAQLEPEQAEAIRKAGYTVLK